MSSEEQSHSQPEFLRVSRFHSIRTKILLFALLATIVPSLILGGLSYLQNSELLRGKISQELRNAAVQSSGEFEIWLKERFYDLRVFSSSYIVSENFARLLNQDSSKIEKFVAFDNISSYLRSVSAKFSVYKQLILLSPAGRPMVASTGDLDRAVVPEIWMDQLHSSRAIGRKAPFHPQVDRGALYIAEAIKTSEDDLIGYLAASIDLNTVGAMLAAQCTGGIDEVYLRTADGSVLVSSEPLIGTPHDADRTGRLSGPFPNQPMEPVDYINFRNRAVVGMVMPISAIDGAMVAEIEKERAYAEIARLRLITIGLVGGLMVCIGLLAYFFGHSLVRPVRRLSRVAAGVATGNLDVDIPVTGLSEVSYLTQVFNHMVACLRHGREEISAANNALIETVEELHHLSITDGLTGLNNRKHIMDLLAQALKSTRENNQPLAVLMLDIDHFKGVNDNHGHQAGDAVMCRLAGALLESVEDGDHVGRYGGEEFMIVLPNRSVRDAALIAEHIRCNVGKLRIAVGSEILSVTVSIGVAGYRTDGSDVESIVREADDALYRAKAGGRDRVLAAEQEGIEAGGVDFTPSNPKLRLIS